MTKSARHALPFLAAGQAQKEVTHNEALALIDAGLHAAAEAIGLNVPPLAPAAGQCWVVGAAPGGAWAGHAHALACWTVNGWRFLAAREGMRVWLSDQQLWADYVGGEWTIGDLRGGRLLIDANQVVGPRLAAVAAPIGGTSVDMEARAAIDALIARLVGHGLIAE